MTSRERILAVLNGDTPDMVPIVPKIAFSNVITCDDMNVRQYMTDPAKMAEACITAYRRCGWDGVSIHTDIGSEGAAIGSIYEQPENEPSKLVKHLIELPDEYEQIVVPDPLTTAPMCTVIEAIKRVKAEIGEESYIISWTNGPLNVASQALPLDELLMGIITDPEDVHKLLKRCLAVSIAYAKELVKAGADAIAFGHATASSTVISRAQYEEFALPYETELIAAIHEAGAKAITHICGNIVPIVDLIAKNGSDVIDFDHECDIALLKEKAPNKVFRGNVAPVTLALGSTDDIKKEVQDLLCNPAAASGILLGSGCEINLNTPLENLMAFVKYGREFGSR